jgi:hypothetical protein
MEIHQAAEPIDMKQGWHEGGMLMGLVIRNIPSTVVRQGPLGPRLQ